MAVRPIFISSGDIEKPFIKKDISFKWVSGVSHIQLCRRRDSLSSEISKLYDIKKWLEVSSMSDKEIGIKLSALNLILNTSNGTDSVQNIYQSSKRYSFDFTDYFKYNDLVFDSTPTGMFYDYIYMCAILQNSHLINDLVQFDIFTDIQFNPNKSLNTQARAVAIFKTLYDNNSLSIINDHEEFKKYYKSIR